MSENKTSWAVLAMLGGVLLGAALGYLVPGLMLATDFIGRIFINALRIIVVPLIVASVVVGVTSLGDIRKVGRVGGRVITYFLATSAFAAILGLVLVYIFNPGSGVSSGSLSQQFIQDAPAPGEVTDLVSALVPDNLIGSLAEGNFLGLILLSIFFGAALSSLGKRSRTTVNFFKEVNDAMMKLVGLLLYTAPIGLLSIVGAIVAANTSSMSEILPSLGWYSLTLLVGMAIHVVIVLPLILKFFGGEAPLGYARNMLPAFLTGIGTSSSSATLPVTYECVVEKNKVDERAGSFVLPLGMTVNMDGSAMYVVIATVFIAQVFGVALSLAQIVTVVAMAVLISVAAAGVPSAALFMLATVFAAIGMPTEAYAGIGLILVVDWILDRGRTITNIWGDAVGAAVIGNSYEMKTARRSARASAPVRSPRTRTRTTPSPGRTRSTGPREPEQRRERSGSFSSSTSSRGADRRTPRARTAPTSQTSRGRRKVQEADASPFEIAASNTPVLSESTDETAAPNRREPAKSRGRESGDRESTQQRSPQQNRSSERGGRRKAASSSEPRAPRTNGNRVRRVSIKERELSKVASRPPEDIATEEASPAQRLSQEKIKRELEKVSAHLETVSSGVNETTPSGEPERDTQVDRTVEKQPVEKPEVKAVETSDEVDVAAVPTEVVKTVKPETTDPVSVVADSESVGDGEAETSAKEDAPADEIQFGRTRPKRGEKLKQAPKPSGDTKPEAVEESFSVEKVQFGRVKRKRTGR